jgi:nicotinamidase-related amidase
MNRGRRLMSHYPNSKTDPETVAGATALLIVDMIGCWDFPDADKLLPAAMAIGPAIAKLKIRARAAGIPVIYCNDNRGRWRSDFPSLVALSVQCGGKVAGLTTLLQPDEEDYFILKPKHSAFFGTPLDLMLQHLQVERIVVTGVSSDQCVLVTASEARMRDFDVVVPSDCVACQSDERNETVLLQLRDTHNLSTQVALDLQLPHAAGRPASVQ